MSDLIAKVVQTREIAAGLVADALRASVGASEAEGTVGMDYMLNS